MYPDTEQAFISAVKEQMQKNNPAEVRQTFERLTASGMDDESALLLMANALANEFNQIMMHGKAYDNARYIRNLMRLPDQPFED